MKAGVKELARIVWDYHHVGHSLRPADVIVVLGSHDIRVAEWGARIYLDGYAPWLVMSGGLGTLTAGRWTRPEAEIFAEIAVSAGVPEERILVEPDSTNTGENITFSDRLLREREVPFQTVLLVQKPYMERRTFATARRHWPKRDLIVSSPPLPMEDYPNEEISRDEMIHIMVGDLQRIRIYGQKGYQVPQVIPEEVWDAARKLIQMGYDRHLVEE